MKEPDPKFKVFDSETGETVDMTVLEETGTAFDPTTQVMDLTKAEKRRTTALMLAIQGYSHLIIKEADYLREASNLARSGNGPALRPATIDGIVEAAWKFDLFIAGRITESETDEPTHGGTQTQDPASEEQST